MLAPPVAVRIDTVVVDGPANRAGLVPGDLIVSVNGEPIGSPADLIASVEFASDDQPLTLGVLRDGQRVTLNVQPEPMLAAPDRGSGPMVVVPVPVGVIIVGITPGGPADLGGLEPGMAVTDVLDHRIRSLADFRKAVALVPIDRDLILRIQHRGRSEFRVILRNLGSVPERSPDSPSGSD
jgi:S1-C subfamily serine protease